MEQDLSENPHLVNEEAMTSGWFIKIEVRGLRVDTSVKDLPASNGRCLDIQ